MVGIYSSWPDKGPGSNGMRSGKSAPQKCMQSVSIYLYIHLYIHTSIHTLHCIALHYITLHSIPYHTYRKGCFPRAFPPALFNLFPLCFRAFRLSRTVPTSRKFCLNGTILLDKGMTWMCIMSLFWTPETICRNMVSWLDKVIQYIHKSSST